MLQPIPTGLLVPDLEMAKRWIWGLHGDGPFWMQTFPEGVAKKKCFPIDKFVVWEEFVRVATKENLNGAAICVAINRLSKQGRANKYARKIIVCVVDVDTVGAPPPNIGFNPHFIIESSKGKYHYYWLVKNCPVTHYRTVQKRLIELCPGADHKICFPAVVMRVPGFWHLKNEPFMTRIVEWNLND